MRCMAKVKGSHLELPDSIGILSSELEIEIELPDDKIITKKKSEGLKFLESLWETVGDMPKGPVNWEKEWHAHLEAKNGL